MLQQIARLLSQRDAQGALSYAQRAMERWERLAAAMPQSALRRSALVTALIEIAQLRRHVGDSAGAEAALARARTAFRDLRRDHPVQSRAMAELAARLGEQAVAGQPAASTAGAARPDQDALPRARQLAYQALAAFHAGRFDDAVATQKAALAALPASAAAEERAEFERKLREFVSAPRPPKK